MDRSADRMRPMESFPDHEGAEGFLELFDRLEAARRQRGAAGDIAREEAEQARREWIMGMTDMDKAEVQRFLQQQYVWDELVRQMRLSRSKTAQVLAGVKTAVEAAPEPVGSTADHAGQVVGRTIGGIAAGTVKGLIWSVFGKKKPR